MTKPIILLTDDEPPVLNALWKMMSNYFIYGVF